MPPHDPDPRTRRLKRVAVLALLFVALTIVAIFVGENLTHKKMIDEAKETNAAAIG